MRLKNDLFRVINCRLKVGEYTKSVQKCPEEKVRKEEVLQYRQEVEK